MSSRSCSSSTDASHAPLFDEEEVDLLHELLTNPTQATTAHTSVDCGLSDLKLVGSAIPEYDLEWLIARLFSADQLNVILKDRALEERFARFLERYQPQYAFQLLRCLKTREVRGSFIHAKGVAQHLERKCEVELDKALEDLISEALPAFITEQLVQVATECLVKQITGNVIPLMRDMVRGLGEVFCITDPRLRDNAIVYASDGFLESTQYTLEYVIGRNCRFLQGLKTCSSSVSRLLSAMQKGTEVCETILHYRRDGTPFINLLMVQPLIDNKGVVRYHLGCQVDVSSLVEGGRGLDCFQKLLQQDRRETKSFSGNVGQNRQLLLDLARQLDSDEVHVLKQSTTTVDDEAEKLKRRSSIRVFPDREESLTKSVWTLEPREPERFPQVYQNYLLIRPSPSFRITFTSKTLRIPGLFKSSFIDRIGGPPHVRKTLQESLVEGAAVTAKILWLNQPNSGKDQDNKQGKPRWIHCTPMYGVDGKIGVWMIIMVESESISGSINVHRRYGSRPNNETLTARSKKDAADSGHLYASYLRREAFTKPMTDQSTLSDDTTRKAAHRETWWKDLGSKLFGVPEAYKCIAAE